MLKKLNSLAQQTATNVSRRQFLGRLTQGAAGAALVAASVVVTGSAAMAGRGVTSRACCGPRAKCIAPQKGCKLVGCANLNPGGWEPILGCLWDCNGVEQTTHCGF
ncbi:MAG: twin-arginine translocation signal domain-containing protein [Planctomycetaceae bacterium]|nr:twin-arginine translocation signal domain-containing protein [Planctomycetaceae bacterium]